MHSHPELRPTDRNAVRTRTVARWCALGAASALLHLLAIQWAGGHIGGVMPAPRAEPPVISATLMTPQPAEPAAPAPPPRRRTPAPAKTLPPEPAVAAPPPVATEPELGYLGEDASVPHPGWTDANPTAPPQPEPETAPPPPQRAVAPPPSATLKYDVRKVPREGNPTHGHGSISWRTDGGRYRIDGEAGVLFITALTFSSEGSIEATGIAPERYSEKRWGKPETSTHFHRERNTISFSASTQHYPRQGGEQDRASIVWQLAAIGRGDGAAFAPDAEIEIFVAGTRDGEVWRIRVIGQESITVDGAAIPAWHVRRAPRAGSYDQALDIWLAPRHDWMPVRLRYTERNGDYLDMTVSGMPRAND